MHEELHLVCLVGLLPSLSLFIGMFIGIVIGMLGFWGSASFLWLTAQGRERREGPHCMPCKYGLIHKAFVVVVRMFTQTQRAEDQFFGTDTEPRVKAG